MADLIVTSLSGQSEILTDYKTESLARKRRVNGERSLSFFVPKTEANAHAFSLVAEESVVEYDGDPYRIKRPTERTIGGTPVKQITAEHVFFDIVEVYHYDLLTPGPKSINELLSYVFRNTGWTFSVIDAFSTVTIEEDDKFGDNNALVLFHRVLELFQAEFDLSGTDVIIRKQIGTTPDFQFRFAHNIKTLSRDVDTSNLSTYIKGFGKQNENGSYVVTAEYTSPLASVYGIRHSPPFRSESITDQATLIDALKKALVDTPEVFIALEFVELQKAGYDVTSPGLGDTVPTIYEPLDIDLDLRILEIEDYPESYKSPKVALSSVRRKFAEVQFDRSKAILDRIWDDNSGNLRYNVYPDAVKRATEAMNNSLTELEYPQGMGIIARDPNDPDKFVAVRSSGIGVTTNGGLTFDEAITALGINTKLLTAGQIKTNNIQIVGEDNLFYWDGSQLIAINPEDVTKFARITSEGLYIAKGAAVIERDDGYRLIIDGKANFDLAVQSGAPQYIDDATYGDGTPIVTIQGPYARVASTSYRRFDYLGFKHTGRFLNVSLYGRGGGAGAYAYVQVRDENGNALATNMTNATGDTAIGLNIDLGVPTGQYRHFYIYFRTTHTEYPALVRMATKYLSG